MEFIGNCLQIKYEVAGANLLSVLELLLYKLITMIFYVAFQKVKEACQSVSERTRNVEER